MKWLISLVLAAGLCAGGYFLYQRSSFKTTVQNQESGRPTTAVAENRDIRFAITAAGEIGPADQVSVRPEVNGRIAELPVDIGDAVTKDTLLCRLDDRDLQIEKSQRVAEIDGAQLTLQKATRNFERSKRLFKDKLIPAEVFEDAKTDYDLATNALARATGALRLVEDRISKTKILAPFDCTILTRPVSLGQTVSGAAGFNSGTEVMTIANLKDMIISAHVNQADVVRLATGQDVDVQVESVPGLKLKGKMERIAPQAVLKNGVKGFAARIQIKEIDARVRPGMTALLNIPVAAADNVLSIPLAAVFSEKGDRFVYVKNGEEYEKRPVLVGVTDYWHAEIQDGLTAGEVVSMEPPPELQPEPPSTTMPPRSSGTSLATGGAASPATAVKPPVPAPGQPARKAAGT